MFKHSKLGLVSFALAAAGLVVVGLNFGHLLFENGYEPIPRFYFWLLAIELVALLIGLASLFIGNRRKLYGALGITMSCVLIVSLAGFYLISFLVIGRSLVGHH